MRREFHGWSRQADNASLVLHIGYLPGRKSPCLYSAGEIIQVHAYFRSEKEARRAMNLLDYLIFGEAAESGFPDFDES